MTIAPAKLPLLLFALSLPAAAQAPPPKPVTLGPLTLTGSLRVRTEGWNWFQGDADNSYLYPGSLARLGLGQTKKAFDWQLEAALPFLLGLPDNSVAPGAQGQLGLGATYYVANNRARNAALPFLKQAFVRFKNLGGNEAHSLRLGRFEFVEGAEVAPKDPTLAAVKRDRIAHRLIGTFAWTHVGRSFDGAHYAYNRGRNNVTLAGARPTRGVFQVDGWGGLDIAFGYGAFTRQTGEKSSVGELRVFGIYYDDWRSVLKTDNRPLAVRRADTAAIKIGTVGAHYLHAFATRKGTFDLMLWGALQTGDWGAAAHRAGAFAVEAGFQPAAAPKLKPWLRAGFHHGSGDNDPNDNRHGSFFQMLPTPRIIQRFPFYDLINADDAFAQFTLRPSPRLQLRTEFHSIRLANRNDLWYQGGGAFQPWTFGFVGRPSGGARGLAHLWDVSLDYTINPHYSLGFYFSNAWGRDVIRSVYPRSPNGRLGFVELNARF